MRKGVDGKSEDPPSDLMDVQNGITRRDFVKVVGSGPYMNLSTFVPRG